MYNYIEPNILEENAGMLCLYGVTRGLDTFQLTGFSNQNVLDFPYRAISDLTLKYLPYFRAEFKGGGGGNPR